MIETLLEKSLAGLGYELIACARVRGGLLRVVIDSLDPQQGILLADCERVSRHLESLLPVEGIDYERIEVSSPGPARLLTKPAHFTRFCGSQARISLRSPIDGRSNLTGAIAASDDDGIVLDCGQETCRIPHAAIAAAHLCDKASLPGART